MPLADLSIDDAIALACREVPECCHALEWHWEDGDSFQTARWVHTEGGPLVDGPMLRAIWFATAWEWLMNRNLAMFEEGTCEWFIEKQPGHGWMTFLDPRFPDPPVNFDGKWTATRTKYHALAAAVLLAAGKVVP